MQQEIDPIGFATDFFEKRFDLGIIRDIAREKWRFFSKCSRQFLDVFFQALALVIENQTCTGFRPSLRDRPCNAALVRDTKNNSNLSFQHGLRHKRSTITAISAEQSSDLLALHAQIVILFSIYEHS